MQEKNKLEELLLSEQKKEEGYVQKLIQLEAEIKKTERQIQRKKQSIKNIKNSNTWKLGAPIHKLLPKFELKDKLLFHEKQIRDLEKKTEELQSEIANIQFSLEKNKNHTILERIKEAHTDGQMIAAIEEMRKLKQSDREFYRSTLKYIGHLFKNKKSEQKHFVYSKLLSMASAEDIPEILLRDGIPIKGAASFRLSLTLRQMENEQNRTPEWMLDDKRVAYHFLDRLGVRRPWISDETYTLEDLPIQDKVAIKPKEGAGSRGVYLVHHDKDILDVKDSKQLRSIDELKIEMNNDIHNGLVDKDEWLMEELIYEDDETKLPARDLKFYCFYRKVGLVLEIIRFPEVKYCWWTANGEIIKTGKYDEALFEGNGFTKEELDFVSQISSSVPSPFIRIDFLRSKEDLVFGEFTPKPGNYDEFNDETDRRLGELYMEARGQLDQDLLNGKEFKEFREITSR